MHGALNIDVERRAAVVVERHVLMKAHAVAGLGYGIERFDVDELWRVPVLIVKRFALGKEDRKLATFRADPEAVFAAVGADVRISLPGGHVLEIRAVDPPKAGALAAGGAAGHHATLKGRGNGHLRLPR